MSGMVDGTDASEIDRCIVYDWEATIDDVTRDHLKHL